MIFVTRAKGGMICTSRIALGRRANDRRLRVAAGTGRWVLNLVVRFGGLHAGAQRAALRRIGRTVTGPVCWAAVFC